MAATPQKYVFIRTFGCQMNEHDSEKIRGLLAAEGYLSTEAPEDADLILFNTCTIREKAHHKAMSEIGRARFFQNRRPGVLIGVCGCVAQEEKTAIFDRFPHVDIVFGPDQIWRLPELLDEVGGRGRTMATDLIDDPSKYRFLGNVPPHLDPLPKGERKRRRSFPSPPWGRACLPAGRGRGEGGPPSAFVSIMKGCNCACSYCIVPSVRGREVCRDPDDVVDEVRRLASSGTKEVTLLGQNVNAYAFRSQKPEARSQKSNTLFAQLLRRIVEETEIARIRFTSPHPRDVGDDLVREYAENEKLMPHVHLPVQAGSNAVLKRMRRGYTRERYLEICGALRAARPGMAITTDLIVGFCGETEEDFEGTIDLMRRAEFDSAFAFAYSPRPGTEATATWADDVPAGEKEERLARVLSLQRQMSRRKNEAQVGREASALATGLDRMKRGLITGRLPDNRIVHFSGHGELIGTIVPLRITAAHDNSLAGEIFNAVTRTSGDRDAGNQDTRESGCRVPGHQDIR